MVDMPSRARFPSYHSRFPLFAGSVRLVVDRGLIEKIQYLSPFKSPLGGGKGGRKKEGGNISFFYRVSKYFLRTLYYSENFDACGGQTFGFFLASLQKNRL